MNAFQALRILDVDSGSSQEEIKAAFRRKALEHHPDKNNRQDAEFKRVTEAYEYLKKNHIRRDDTRQSKPGSEYKRKPRGAPDDEKVPEQDWSKYTKEFEEGNPDFWKEYEKNFWEEYNARVRPDGRNGEYEKAKEPERQPSLSVDVDKSLCIGCCSCETIAPDVFEINKKSMMNPKSSVINPSGAGVNKIMDAAMTCPTKAIIIEDVDTRERLYPH